MALNAERRMSFAYTPGKTTDQSEDAGTKLDAEARKIQFASTKPMTYSEALHLALRQNPELSRAYFSNED